MIYVIDMVSEKIISAPSAKGHRVTHEHILHHPYGVQGTLVSGGYAYALGYSCHHLHEGCALQLCTTKVKV